MFSNALSRFRTVAFLEGCSLLLFAITMPLKYGLGITWPNYIIGVLHGFLFVVYCILLLQVAIMYKWSFKKMAFAFLASFVPFGTFYADKKWFRPQVS